MTHYKKIGINNSFKLREFFPFFHALWERYLVKAMGIIHYFY